MEDHFYSLTGEKFDSISIILDASESADKAWNEIVTLTKEILRKLPRDIQKKLFFLGNPKEYDTEIFEENVSEWMRENRTRGSFITPIFESLRDSKTGKIVVLGSGIIYDLEDWTGSELYEDLLLIKVGESMLEKDIAGNEIDSTNFSAGSVINSVISVQICGNKEFMPYFWDNPGYILSNEGDLSLRSSNPQKNLSVNFAAFGSKIFANVEKKGSRDKIILSPSDQAQTDPVQIIEQCTGAWHCLTVQEETHFKQNKDAERVYCPHCQGLLESLHCLGTVCRQTKLLGKIIYSSLEKNLESNEIKGFIVFRETSDGRIQFKKYPSKIIKINDRQISIQEGSRSHIYEYVPNEERWAEKGKLRIFHSLGRGYYVAVV